MATGTGQRAELGFAGRRLRRKKSLIELKSLLFFMILKALLRPWGFMLRFMIVVRMICYVILRLVCLTPPFL